MKKNVTLICILIVVTASFSGCIDKSDNASAPSDSRFAGIYIQSEMTTPEGLVVKIWVHRNEHGTEWIEGVIENPTSNVIRVQKAGIGYKYVDERSLDKHVVWKIDDSGLVHGATDINPRYSEDFQCYLKDGTMEIRPYVKTYLENGEDPMFNSDGSLRKYVVTADGKSRPYEPYY